MSIPDFQTLMLPVLRSACDGEVRITEVVDKLADEFKLTSQERSELLPSGQTIFYNRTQWAKSYLGKAGLVELTRRAHFRITDSGRQVLASPPERIDVHFLEQFPEFVKFRSASDSDSGETGVNPLPVGIVQNTGMTPDEMIRAAHGQLEDALAQELLERVIAAPPDFFERLIVQLLVAMGYGGSAADAGRALGKSGDGGVDGVIDQDALGMDRIYVQAKRYADGNSVGSGAIRDFFGSLDRFKAAKGLFVTTSTFSPSAKETADFLSKRIVLIDGRQFAKLMIRYDVGCRIEETIHLKKIDEELFE